MKLEIKGNVVGGTVVQIVKTITNVEQALKQVVPGIQGEDRMERSNRASSSRKVEEIT